MKLILQEELFGCGIACLAMILGRTYAEVRKDFENDFEKKPYNWEKFLDYISEQGYTIIEKRLRYYSNIADANKEMLKPLAPVHLIATLPRFDSKYSHLLVMDAKGKIYDPAGHKSDYVLTNNYSFDLIAGIWRDETKMRSA